VAELLLELRAGFFLHVLAYSGWEMGFESAPSRSGIRIWDGFDVDNVQLRIKLLRQIDRGSGSEPRVLGTVGSQKYPRWKILILSPPYS
jgi:hypothetical protein